VPTATLFTQMFDAHESDTTEHALQTNHTGIYRIRDEVDTLKHSMPDRH
jgi:hypothetical protein